MHPFFDSPTYPWHRDDARELHRVLFTAIRGFQDIDSLYRGSASGLPGLPNLPSDAMWKSALDSLSLARGLAALCKLLLANPLFAGVHPAVRAVQEAPNPLEAPVLGKDETVFLDRKKLRVHLDRLGAQDTSFRVLLVRGEPGSGKSWTAKMVEWYAAAQGDACVYLFDGVVATVSDVLDNLFGALGTTNDLDALESEDAYFKKACAQLLVLASKAQKRFWVVVDDLGHGVDGPRLDPSIKRFFGHLALQLSNPALGRWFRLVLLHFPDGDAAMTKWKQGAWDEDRVSGKDVDATLIAEFLLRWGKLADKQLADEERRRLAEGIIGKIEEELPKALAAAEAKARAEAPAGESPEDTQKRVEKALAAVPSRMQRIHDEVKATITTLRESGGT